ncbi:MAG: transposase [Pseudomonadota bacterium]
MPKAIRQLPGDRQIPPAIANNPAQATRIVNPSVRILLRVGSKRKAESVANSKAGVADLLVWVAKQGVTLSDLHAILEGTGVYHETAAFPLHKAGVTVSIVNPAQVRDFARGLAVRTKTDSVDSRVLARYGALVRPKPWTPPHSRSACFTSLAVLTRSHRSRLAARA